MQVNHALAVLSRANETVVRSTNEHDLLNEMCRVLTETVDIGWPGSDFRPHGPKGSCARWPQPAARSPCRARP